MPFGRFSESPLGALHDFSQQRFALVSTLKKADTLLAQPVLGWCGQSGAGARQSVRRDRRPRSHPKREEKDAVPSAIRKILVPLHSTAASGSALATALLIAHRWEAHVAALHVRADVGGASLLAGEGLAGAMVEEAIAAAEKESGEGPGSVRALFDRAIAEQGVALAEPTPDQRFATASFTATTGREEELVAHQARLADLTVVVHPATSGAATSVDVLHAVLFDFSRPVLVAPERRPASIGRRICIAWNGTAELASAVAAAFPWLECAEAVRVLSAVGYQRRGPAAQELAPYLALHGVNAELVTFRPVDGVVGAGLLVAAAEFGADLLATGAYSHSRLRQFILGGVTRHVLGHARLPVLMCR